MEDTLMFIQPEYFVAIITSYADSIGESGITFGTGKQRRMLNSMARSYSQETDGIVIFGNAKDNSLIHAYYHGIEVYPSHDGEDERIVFVCTSNGCLEKLRENDSGFYLEMA